MNQRQQPHGQSRDATSRRADLVAVDIGNSTTQVGAFAGETLLADWRVSSALDRTADEIRHLLVALAGEAAVDLTGSAAIVCSVVPILTQSFVTALEGASGRAPWVVDSGLDLGVPIRYLDPSQVGPDRLANAVAAAERHRLPAIVVDLGTAITFDVVSASGEYLGGAIAPGIRTAADALFRRAARLPRVELELPASAIGRTTTTSIQSGLVLGAAILIDGLVERIAAELDAAPCVIATGGDAGLVRAACHAIDVVDPCLTLHGMRLVAGRLARGRPSPTTD
ncbi:MAG: type III pantothenate kinase [Candidatus Eiseniibacteriota bacterium]|jgi:type III pantothenate kinase